MLYAESNDGLKWQKLNLNKYQTIPGGGKENNIFLSRRFFYTATKDTAPPLRMCRKDDDGKPIYCDSVEKALGRPAKCNVNADVSELESDSEEQCYTNQDHNPCIIYTPHLGKYLSFLSPPRPRARVQTGCLQIL